MNRLYVLIDSKYDTSYRGCQGGHAAIEYVLRFPEAKWKNETLIFLQTDDINFWIHKLKTKNKDFVEWYEPDVSAITAIATLDSGHMFKHLELS